MKKLRTYESFNSEEEIKRWNNPIWESEALMFGNFLLVSDLENVSKNNLWVYIYISSDIEIEAIFDLDQKNKEIETIKLRDGSEKKGYYLTYKING